MGCVCILLQIIPIHANRPATPRIPPCPYPSTYLAVVGHSQMDPALVHSAPHLRLLPERLCDQHLERQRHDLLIRIDVLRSVDAADLRAVEPHVPTRETRER